MRSCRIESPALKQTETAAAARLGDKPAQQLAAAQQKLMKWGFKRIKEKK